jgi:hypothetical protein
MKSALIILAFAAAVSAEVVTTYDSRTNGTPFSSRVQAVDIGVTDTQKNPDFQLWMRNIEAPALADLNTRMIVKITGTLAQARADLRQAKQSAREAIPAHKFYRQAWRQVQRNIAQAIGLPATNGLTWGVEETYSALATVTNATTRRDYHLRTLEADLNQTRHQLERQFSQINFWWTPEDTE